MECSCIDACVDEFCECLEDNIVTAKKQHICDECRKIIEYGQQYRREKTVFNGKFNTHKNFLDCNSIR